VLVSATAAQATVSFVTFGAAESLAATVVFLLAAVSTPLHGAVAKDAGWEPLWVSAAALAAVGALVAVRLPPASVR
jgi:hypothetical protein